MGRRGWGRVSHSTCLSSKQWSQKVKAQKGCELAYVKPKCAFE
uniref:Uncharacterized protein n=1 Tax=Anguilla anguilla TaxID=7936 RepID=A0A0E9TST3_ANGAN